MVVVVVFLVLLSDHFADCAHLCHALGDLAQGLLGAGTLPVPRVDTPRCRRMDGGERDAGVALAPAADAPSGLTATRTVLQGTPTSLQGGGSLSWGGEGLLPSLALRFSPAVKPGEIHTPNREPINNPRGPSHTHHDVQPPPLPGYEMFSSPPKVALNQLGVPPGPLPSEPDTSVLSASGFARSG